MSIDDENRKIDIYCPWCDSLNNYGDIVCVDCKESLPIFYEGATEPIPSLPIRILPQKFKRKLYREYFLYPLLITIISTIFFLFLYNSVLINLFIVIAIFSSSIATIYGYWKYKQNIGIYIYGLTSLAKIISYRAMKIYTDEDISKSDDKIVLNYSFILNNREYFFQKETDRSNYLIPISLLNIATIWVVVDKDDVSKHNFYPPVF